MSSTVVLCSAAAYSLVSVSSPRPSDSQARGLTPLRRATPYRGPVGGGGELCETQPGSRALTLTVLDDSAIAVTPAVTCQS